MAGKPLTSEAIAMTEKKMDMSLDDIIKMSKTDTTKPSKKQRLPNRSQNFLNNAIADKPLRLRRFMDSKSSIRQGALAQRRSNFQGNHFPLAVEAARTAATVPIRDRNFNRNRTMNMNQTRITGPAVQRRPANGGFAVKRQPPPQQKQLQGNVVLKQRSQTLDSLFANMKEQRMKVINQQQNGNSGRHNNGPPGQQNGYGRPNGPGLQNGYGRRYGPGQQNGNGRSNGQGHVRPRPPWGRYND